MRWRVIDTDTESADGIAPVRPDQDNPAGEHVIRHRGEPDIPDPYGIYDDCCPPPFIEPGWGVKGALALIDRLNGGDDVTFRAAVRNYTEGCWWMVPPDEQAVLTAAFDAAGLPPVPPLRGLERYHGEWVTSMADGELIVLGHHTTRAVAAMNAYSRGQVGLDNMADDRSATLAEVVAGLQWRWAKLATTFDCDDRKDDLGQAVAALGIAPADLSKHLAVADGPLTEAGNRHTLGCDMCRVLVLDDSWWMLWTTDRDPEAFPVTTWLPWNLPAGGWYFAAEGCLCELTPAGLQLNECPPHTGTITPPAIVGLALAWRLKADEVPPATISEASAWLGYLAGSLEAADRMQLATDAALHSVWLHGGWLTLLRRMETYQQKAAAAAVQRHSRLIGGPGTPPLTGLLPEPEGDE